MSLFVTFEGPDGSGKTTQMTLLRSALEARGYAVVATREPGGTRIGNAIRTLVLDPANPEMDMRAETLLYVAARAQIVHEIIRPALAAGAIVLCDRYGDSTLAYQGYGHTQSLETLRMLNAYATGDLQPELTLYIDIDAAAGLSRIAADGLDRLEANSLAFHEAVRAGYHMLAQADGARWQVLDGAQTIAALHGQILAHVTRALAAQA